MYLKKYNKLKLKSEIYISLYYIAFSYRMSKNILFQDFTKRYNYYIMIWI